MPTRWKLVGGDHLELGAACHLFGDHTINWKKHANAAVLRECRIRAGDVWVTASALPRSRAARWVADVLLGGTGPRVSARAGLR